MYGQTLPNTGLASITLLGISFNSMWLALGLLTVGAVLVALVRILPRKEL